MRRIQKNVTWIAVIWRPWSYPISVGFADLPLCKNLCRSENIHMMIGEVLAARNQPLVKKKKEKEENKRKKELFGAIWSRLFISGRAHIRKDHPKLKYILNEKPFKTAVEKYRITFSTIFVTKGRELNDEILMGSAVTLNVSMAWHPCFLPDINYFKVNLASALINLSINNLN